MSTVTFEQKESHTKPLTAMATFRYSFFLIYEGDTGVEEKPEEHVLTVVCTVETAHRLAVGFKEIHVCPVRVYREDLVFEV